MDYLVLSADACATIQYAVTGTLAFERALLADILASEPTKTPPQRQVVIDELKTRIGTLRDVLETLTAAKKVMVEL